MKYAPDEGWAWAVTFAGFVVNLVVTGAGRMSAILYVALMDTYGVSRKQAITPFTTRSAVKSLLGPVVGILGQHYGVRVVIISGAATALLGLILCFFTQDILWITVYYGVLTGIGAACCSSLVQLIVDQYFYNNRVTASGLSLAGSSVGSIVFPVIGDYILMSYGVQGTFLVIGGIFMHVIPSAIVMKEPPWIKTKSVNAASSANHKHIPENTTSYSPQEAWSQEIQRTPGCSAAQGDCVPISYIYTGDLSRNQYYGSVSTQVDVGDFKHHINAHPQEKHPFHSVQRSRRRETELGRVNFESCEYIKVILKTLKNALRINLSPSFQFIRLSKTASFFVVSPMTTVILDFALDQGIEEHKVVYIISMLSVGELLGRTGFGLITDRNFVSMEFFMGTAMVLQGICTATIPTVSSFVLMLTAVLVFGLLQGVIMARYPVLVAEYTKSEDQYVAMGSINVLIGIVAFFIPHFVGYFRDTLGSYDGVFLTVAAVISVMGIMWLILPRVFTLKVEQEKKIATEP